MSVEPSPDVAVAGALDGVGEHVGGVGHDAADAEGLIELSRMVQAIHGRVAAEYGLTQVQAKMVCILVLGSRGMADLAHCLGVEKATLTGLVDRAERRGLVTRCRVASDRRALNVGLTDTGRRTAAAFHADAVEQLNELLLPIPPQQVHVFRDAIATILAANRGPVEREPTSQSEQDRDGTGVRS